MTTTIDWDGQLEAVHEDGEVIDVECLEGCPGDLTEFLPGGWISFGVTGKHSTSNCPWYIRNCREGSSTVSMIETIARSLAASTLVGGYDQAFVDGRWPMHADEARAVLKSICEPTPAMTAAGAASLSLSEDGGLLGGADEAALNMWREMVRAELAEQ